MIASATIERIGIDLDPVGSWLFVAVVTVTLAGLLMAFGPDQSRLSRPRLTMLVLLRLASFLCLVTAMLRPTLVATQKARQEATLLVLADASESMTVADGSGGRTRWQEMVDALATASPAAKALEKTRGITVEAWEFDRDTRRVEGKPGDPFPLGAWERRPDSGETAIGAAIETAVRTAGSRPLAGVILLGDGGQQAYPPRDLPPQTAARRLGEAAVPMWTVTFGQARGGPQARDAALVGMSVADRVFAKNTVEVSGRVRLDGFGDREAVIRLLVEDGVGVMQEVARSLLRGNPERVEETVRLSWAPLETGERKVALVVDPLEGETVTSNNELSSFVEIAEGGLRVVYLEGALRVEQRFLRRAIAASPDIQVDFQWIDSARRDRWPVDLEADTIDEADVFLIGDLDSAAVAAKDLETVRRRVEAGAGIGLLGGFHAFEAGGWGSTPLRPLLPFEKDPLARQRFDEPLREGVHMPGLLPMLPHPRFGTISILRLGDTEAASLAAWRSLPPLHGGNQLGRLTPLARPLAVTTGDRPLLVGRDYGLGRVLAFAADSTWRWVMQGHAEEHRRFWRQLILWLAKKDDADGETLWVRPAQRRIAAGMPLAFDAGITRPDGTLVEGVMLDAVAISPTGAERPVRLARRGETYAGSVSGADAPGDWRLVVTARRAGENGPAMERTCRFTVTRQNLELAAPRANALLMRQVAEETNGGPRLPEELPEIFSELADQPATFTTSEQWSITLWDSWPLFLLLVLTMCLEWFLRKRWGLV
jgi:hypothetical protein